MIKKQVTVYLCENCDKSYEIAEGAKACEENHKRISHCWSEGYKGPGEVISVEDLRE
jgi:hypothetical protein